MKRLFFLLCFIIQITFLVEGNLLATGFPDSIVNSQSGPGWIDLESGKQDDGTFTSVSLLRSETSSTLLFTNFNVSLPSNAIIQSIGFDIRRRASHNSSKKIFEFFINF